MPLQKETNFHLPFIDCGSCRDMEKPIPPFPFIGLIKNSSCPNSEGISTSLLNTNWGFARICFGVCGGKMQTLKVKSRI